MNLRVLLNAMTSIENDRKISKQIVIEALKEALSKAYKKHVDLPDVEVRVDINEKSGQIKLYQRYLIVENVEDDEFEISLEDAKRFNQSYQLGEYHEEEKPIDELGRAAALLAKNVMKQKIREAEKLVIYEEYIDLLGEMISGVVESVEENFVVVNIGKTMALMLRNAQIPNEKYREGQRINVVITECNRESKGAQILVSRAEATLVKRLFEREVPEIYDGTVEIKAIARDAGERCKMAVYSNNPDVDPIGACIGPKGQRVSAIINEISGEKIDIFEWSNNVVELVKNSLAPAEVLAVIENEDKKSILVVVDESQLSLAIGKKGKNARLAVKLTGKKIDIKTCEDVEKMGIDWQAIVKQQAEALVEENQELIDDAVVDIVEEVVEEPINVEKNDNDIEDKVSTTEVVLENEDKVEEAEPVEKVVEPKRVKKELVKKESTYVSKFEKIMDSKPTENKEVRHKKKTSSEDDRKLRLKDIKKDKDYLLKPIYTDEELEEIKRNEELEADDSFYDEIDYDEFDDFYDAE